jgi:hypothetical protein
MLSNQHGDAGALPVVRDVGEDAVLVPSRGDNGEEAGGREDAGSWQAVGLG